MLEDEDSRYNIDFVMSPLLIRRLSFGKCWRSGTTRIRWLVPTNLARNYKQVLIIISCTYTLVILAVKWAIEMPAIPYTIEVGTHAPSECRDCFLRLQLAVPTFDNCQLSEISMLFIPYQQCTFFTLFKIQVSSISFAVLWKVLCLTT